MAQPSDVHETGGTPHPETRDYIARKTSEGKTTRDAIRCLKRHLTRRIWQLLQPPNPTQPKTLTSPMSLTRSSNSSSALWGRVCEAQWQGGRACAF